MPKKQRLHWNENQENMLHTYVLQTPRRKGKYDWGAIAERWNAWNAGDDRVGDADRDIRTSKQLATKYNSMKTITSDTSSISLNGEVSSTVVPFVSENEPDMPEESPSQGGDQTSASVSASAVIHAVTAALALNSTSSSSIFLHDSNSSNALKNPKDKQVITDNELRVMTAVFDNHFPTREKIKWRKFHEEWIKEAMIQKSADHFLELYNRSEQSLKEKFKYLKKIGRPI
jgi:hypothetical protein